MTEMAVKYGGEWSELDNISVDLKDSVNIPNLRPFFRAEHFLTESELEQVEISAINPRHQAIDKLISILKTKGPDHAEQFLKILRMSLDDEDSHKGHEYVCERLEAAIRERKGSMDMQHLKQAVNGIHIPGHRPATAMDSGIGPLDLSSAASSPESLSCGSSIVGSPAFGESSKKHEEEQEGQKLLPNRGLRNLENHRPSLDERQVSSLRHKIIRDNESITDSFAIMVVGVYRLLKQKNAPVDEVRLMLQFLGCQPGKPNDGNMRLFSTSDEFSDAKDLVTLIECLRKYSSWYNYRLMKVVAVQFAGKEGKLLISDYEDDLRKHYISLIAYQCPEFTLGNGVPPGYTRLTVKVDWNYRSTNLQHITLFQASLADILELEPYVFQLLSVEEGCVLFDWAVPDAVESHVVSKMIEKEECLKEQRVLYLEIASAKRVFTERPSLPPKIWENLSTPKRKVLSISSSIASVLEVPMSPLEEELLSCYSPGGSVDGGSLQSINSRTAENPSEVRHTLADDGDRTPVFAVPRDGTSASVFERMVKSPSTTDLAPRPQMKRNFCSEGDLLSSSHHFPLLAEKEGLSLPDITGEIVLSTMPRKQRKPKKGLLRSLKKMPRKFLKQFRHSKGSDRENVYPPDSPILENPVPVFSLLELTAEPRKLGSDRDKPQVVASYNYTMPLHQIVDWKFQTDEKPDIEESSVPFEKKLPATPSNQQPRPDSAISIQSPPNSPFPTDGPPQARTLENRKHCNHMRDSTESGLGASFNSGVGRPYLEYMRQPSGESEESVSLNSSECVSHTHRRKNSYTISHYMNLAIPIYEEPADDVTPHQVDDLMLSDMATGAEAPSHQIDPPIRPRDADYMPESWQLRDRSHSHGEDYYHRMQHIRNSSAASSSHSSGYSSYASSNRSSVAHVESESVVQSQSQESLESGKMSPYPHSPNMSAPFPHYPQLAGVRRGGSLKATSRYSTTRSQNQHHARLHSAHRSID